MNNTDILIIFNQILDDCLGHQIDGLNQLEHYSLDSMKLLEIVVYVQKKFKIKFTTKELLEINSLNDILSLVQRNLNGTA
jgi:acyl carrier protein